MGFLIFAGIIAVIGIIIWAAWFYEKKRSEALEYIATSMNFSFVRKGYHNGSIELDNFDLLSKGRSRKASNIMTGTTGDMEIIIMDYQYTVGNGKNSTTHSQTLIAIQSPLLHLPVFTLSPENIFHKIGSVFGYKDIDFDSHPIFSKKYLLRGEDEESIRETFNDEVLQYYEKDKTLSTGGDHNKFIYYRSSKRIAPKEIQAFLQEGINLYGLLKTQDSGLH